MNYIFDFDGTLADSLHVVLKIANDLGVGVGIHINSAEMEQFRKMSSRQVIRHFKVPFWRLPKMLKQGGREFHDSLPKIKTFEGLPAALAALQARGDTLYILTSNTAPNVEAFLEQAGLRDFFTELYTNSSLFGKAAHLKKIMRSRKLKKSETVYIGDETRDIQAAHRAGLRIISVAWGFNHESILQKYKPEFLIHKPAELVKVL